MKLARFLQGETIRYGFIVGGMVVPHESVKVELPESLDDLVESGNLVNPEFLLEMGSALSTVKERISLKKVKLLQPLRSPGKVVCLGRNYPEPAIEGGSKAPKGLPFFLKPNSSLTGPFDPVIYPESVRQLDYEGELAVVVGRTVKNGTREEAMHCVAGYTIMDDVSARDVQLLDRQWTRGKSFDTFGPMGPWITTREEIPAPMSLYIKTWVNDEIRQDSDVSQMMRKVDEIIAHLSTGMTLEAGDVIATGTPEGVGFYLRPEPKLLAPGDRVRVEIERLGYIENQVQNPA